MTTSTLSETFADERNDMPWDEAIEPPIHAVLDDIEESWSSIDGAPSDHWRRLGQARRKHLLEEDRRRGQLSFDLNICCHVDRYFQVAHRALEQFLTKYQKGETLEETYIMGNRMLTFMTECLPNHPGFHEASTATQRKECFRQLEKLQSCMDDLAMRIDEAQADSFAENFDPLSSQSPGYDSEDDDMVRNAFRNWVTCGSAFKDDEERQGGSPGSTVGTSSTDPLEASDFSSSDDDMQERPINDDTPESPLFMMELGTEFLEKIAAEKIEYETDSQAVDSWAQFENSQDCVSNLSRLSQIEPVGYDHEKVAFAGLAVKTDSNSNTAYKAVQMDLSSQKTGEVTSEPLDPLPNLVAEIAQEPPGVHVLEPEFQGLAEGHQHVSDSYRPIVVSDDQQEISHRMQTRPMSFREKISQRQRPEFELVQQEVDNADCDAVEDNTFRRRGCPRESAVMSEIEKFLDSSFDYDPSVVFESSMERLNAKVSGTRARPRTLPGSELSLPKHADNNGWVYFD